MTQTPTSRAGRPRPLNVIKRDAAVLALLHEAPRSRAEVVKLLRLTPAQAYLALRRLNKSGAIQRMPNGDEHQINIWMPVMQD